MKLLLFTLLFLTGCPLALAQKFTLKIIGNSTKENTIIDSLQYKITHFNQQEINDEIHFFSKKLTQLGFLEHTFLDTTQSNDYHFISKISLGKRIRTLHIYLPVCKKNDSTHKSIDNHPTLHCSQNLEFIKNLLGFATKDTLAIPFAESAAFLESAIKKLESNGFAFATVQLTNLRKVSNSLYAALAFNLGNRRALQSIVLKFESNKNIFPKSHLKQLHRKYKNSVFNQEILAKITNDFNQFGFVKMIKNPEILFKNDSTSAYFYIDKAKSNSFDGFICFANDGQKKLILNGYLDLMLENALVGGEKISLYWKKDGTNQKTLKISLDAPYILNSPIGLKTQIHIYKQDSLFQNTKTSLDIGYLMNYNTRIYMGYQTTESTAITTNVNFQNYKNSFITLLYEFSKGDTKNIFFPSKTSFSARMATGKRTANPISSATIGNKQQYISVNALHNFYINPHHSFAIHIQNYFLFCNQYMTNELLPFGGVQSIRGFAENSLQARFLNSLQTEYRYTISPQLLIHSIVDYAYYEDPVSTIKDNLIGFGFGLGLKTKNGLLRLSLANGAPIHEKQKISNSLLSINYNLSF